MPNTSEIASGVRVAWACTVVNVCQGLLAYTLDGDPHSVSQIATRLQWELPPPATPTESLHLVHHLIAVLDRTSEALHSQFHARFSPRSCGLRPPRLGESVVTGPAQTADYAIQAWHSSFRAWFATHHAYPPALRAKTLLEERFAEPWTTASLAKAVGAGRTALLAQFEQAFGMPPAEYLARVRLREGLRLLRDPNINAVEAANAVGYRSVVKFSGRLRQYTAHTPAQIRRLPVEEFDRLLEDRLGNGWCPRGAARSTVTPDSPSCRFPRLR